MRHFGAFLIAAVLVSMLPAPWHLAALAFLAGAAVCGVRALVVTARARLSGGLVAMLTVGLVLTGLLGVGTLGSLALWPVESDRQDCLRGALTQSARTACEQEYRDAVSDWTQRVPGANRD